MLPASGGSTSTPSRTTRRQIQTQRNPPRTTYRAPSGGGGGYRPPARQPIRTPSRMPSGGPGPTAGGGRSPSVSAPARPVPPSAKAFLSKDIGYQQSLNQFAKNWSNFMADKARQGGVAKVQYGQQKKNLGVQRDRDLADIMNDFAGRGMLKSGLYAARQGEYERDYNTNLTSFQQQYEDFLNQLKQSQTQLQSQQGLGREQARQEALARRASKYGL